MKTLMRLDRLLSNMGYGTRSEIKQFVKKGNVKVNDSTVKDPSIHVNPYSDDITIDGEKLVYKEFIYIMLNKPAGVISATYDNKLPTVIDILPDEFKCFDISPVGRLDIDTEGLLILTNDGRLSHELLSPKKHVPKKYFANVEGSLSDNVIKRFKKGIKLDDGYVTMPAEINVIKNDEISEVELVIHEGKFHQIKRMFEALGKKVLYLKRIEMGQLKLDTSLKEGESKELTEEELTLLKNQS